MPKLRALRACQGKCKIVQAGTKKNSSRVIKLNLAANYDIATKILQTPVAGF